jgi:ferrous iron transport protein B
MKIRIALVGNPNSGKTTLFNTLTGSSQYVGNWPGVTVEKKAGKLKDNKEVEIVDLPGIYSLSPYTLEEVVSRNYLMEEKPDAIINIVDSTNIERNLYLTTQLTEIGIPVVIALNMTDIIRKNGDIIDNKGLSRSMGCEVVEISALKGEGCKEVIEKAIALAGQKVAPKHTFSKKVEQAITEIEGLIAKEVDNSRWYAVKLFERDKNVIEKVNLSSEVKARIEAIIAGCEKELDDDSESIITNERYNYIGDVTKKCVNKKNKTRTTVSDKIDNIVTNRLLALPIFALVMFLVYYVSISTVGTLMTDWVNDVLFGKIIPVAVESFLISVGSAQWLNSLILDGVIAGVGAVLGFLPQMLVLFFFLGLLEDSGYMARVAFIMDRIFRKFGLSGKSFIPMLIGTGCSVPGIMASRTIENEHDRKMTIITTSFIPCSAKLPVIALIIGAMFPNSVWMAPIAYFIGVAAVVISGVILKKTKAFLGEESPFVMELPPYKSPSLKGLIIHMWDRGKSFIKKAGTVIFLASGVIWFVSNFNLSMQMVGASESILASVGSRIAIIFRPLGWGDWKATVATITGFVAKENIVSTLGILYGFSEVAEGGAEIWLPLSQSFTQLSAFSFLVFNLLCAPCFAAVGAIKREMGNMKWTLIAIGYQTGFAYAISLIIFQFGSFLNGGGFGIGTIMAVAMLVLMVYLIFRPKRKCVKSNGAWKGIVEVQGG